MIFKMHANAQRELEELRDKHAKTTKDIADILEQITEDVSHYDGKQTHKLINKIMMHYENYDGGIDQVVENCHKVSAYNSKNHLPLLWCYFEDKCATLFNLMDLLQIQASNQNKDLINAMNYIFDHR